MNACRSVLTNVILFSLIGFIFQAGYVWGQFSVVSTIPANGTTGVDTAATFSMTFSSPIDTSARFPYPEDFFINLMVSPDSLVGNPDSITLSSDFKTVQVHNLHLAENTDYWFVIADAVSQNGDSLALPYSIAFSTGASLPSGTVGGTVSYPAGNPAGTLIALFDKNPFGNNEAEIHMGAIVPAQNGAYTIDYVAPGTYWPAAVQEFYIDEWGVVEITPHSVLGMYDVNGDFLPDSIVVPSGGQLSGIDISLHQLYLQTARDPYPVVETQAQSWSPDAYLTVLGGEAQPDGRALFWQYQFYSPSLLMTRGWMVAGDFITRVSTDSFVSDTTALPANWLNSDTVLAIAEANGGYEFRMAHPNTQIFAMLGHLFINDKAEINFSFGNTTETISRLPADAEFGDPSDISPSTLRPYADFPAIWMVRYEIINTDTSLVFFMDPVSGIILNKPATARAAEQAALPVAQNWSGDARLWSVLSNWANVDSVGRSQWWNCLYYSPSLDSLHIVAVWGRLVFYEGDPGWGVPDTATVDPGWIDSDTAIGLAEAAGGAVYRQQNQNVLVSAYLNRWWYGPHPEMTIWNFIYTSTTSDSLSLVVDAINGTLVSIDRDRQPHLQSRNYELYPAYPNPFNPATHIKYYLPMAGKTELNVFNLLGQKMVTLVDAYQISGLHHVIWKPEHLSSGLYFLELRSGDFRMTRKVFYLK